MFKQTFLLLVAIAVIARVAVAEPEYYVVDPTHTFPNIEFSHMNISVWRGKFNKTTGDIMLDRTAKTGTVDIKVDPASINFGLDDMDEKARSDAFFNVAEFPDAGYRGTIQFDGDKLVAIEGEITLLGVTRPLSLTINSFNCIQHPMLNKQVCGADAQGELNWSEYGMEWSKYGEGDAGRVKLQIQVEALKQE